MRLRPLLRRQIEVVSAHRLHGRAGRAAGYRHRGRIARIVVDSIGTGEPGTTGGIGGTTDAGGRASEAGHPSPAGSTTSGSGTGAKSGFDIAIEDFRLSRGAVHVVDSKGAPILDLGGLNADLRATAARTGDLDVSGNIDAASLLVHLPGGTLGEGLRLQVSPNLHYQAAEDRLAITEFDIDLGGLPIALTGQVDDIAHRRMASLRFQGGPAELEGILGFLPSGFVPQLAGVQSSGKVQLKGTLDGSLLDSPPPFAVDLQLTDGRLRHPQLPEPLTDLELSLHADPQILRIESLRAESANSKVSVKGAIAGYREEPTADLQIQADADLSLVAALQKEPDFPSLAGRVNADVTARGPLEDPSHPPAVAGRVALNDVSVEGGALERPIRHLGGTLDLSGTSLTTSGVDFQIGRSDYHITGSVKDYAALMPEAPGTSGADLQVKSRLLDLDEYAPPKPGTSSGGKTPSSTAGETSTSTGAETSTSTGAETSTSTSGTTSAPGSAPTSGSGTVLRAPQTSGDRAAGGGVPPGNAFFALLAKLDGPVRFQADRMIVRGVETQSVDAAGRLQTGLVSVDKATLGLFGGTARASGTVDLRTLTHPQLDLDLAVKGAQASELFKQAATMNQLARLGGYLSGTLDVAAKLQGSTDAQFQIDLRTLTSTGNLELAGGKLTGHPLQAALGSFLEVPQLQSVPIKDWLQPFSIENGRLEYRDLRIDALGAELRADGWQSIEGQLGMNATLLLPPELSQGLRRYVPKELQSVVFEPQAGRIMVPITASGPVQAPRVTLDAQKLEVQAKARLAEQVDAEKKKVEQQLQDEAKAKADEAKQKLLDQVTGSDASADSTASDLQKEVQGVLKNLFKKKK
ncbi:MAG: AsmA-like C-terminal region-containing protein [Candidatus Eisenbacteria bacterium]